MTVRFKRIRTTFHVGIFLFAGAVLGLSGYFADQFLPDDTRGKFIIYSLVIPSVTILWGIVQLVWAQTRTEAIYLFVAGVLWLAEAAWATDQAPREECFALSDTTRATNRGTITEKGFCYESKVVEAFSWTIFLCFAIFFVIVVSLANKSKVLGAPDIWYDPVNFLPWYGELPGYPGGRWFNSPYHMYHHRYGYGQGAPQISGPIPAQNGATVNIGGQTYTQLPGHSLVIHPGANGAPARVENVPGHYGA